MAIIRSRASTGGMKQLQNAAVERALVDWQEKVDAAHEAGRQQGLQEAAAHVAAVDARIAEVDARTQQQLTDAEEAWHQRWDSLLSLFQVALADVALLEKQALLSAEGQLVRLANDIAGKICYQHMEADADWMQTVLSESLQSIPDKRAVRVRMHPHDAEILRGTIDEVYRSLSGSGEMVSLQIEDDMSLQRGSLIMDSQGTRVNAGIPSTWQRMTEALRAASPADEWSAEAVAKDAYERDQNPQDIRQQTQLAEAAALKDSTDTAADTATDKVESVSADNVNSVNNVDSVDENVHAGDNEDTVDSEDRTDEADEEPARDADNGDVATDVVTDTAEHAPDSGRAES